MSTRHSGTGQAYHALMLRGRKREVAELLLKTAELGQVITRALAEAVEDESLVTNTHIAVLSRLELYGPQRPSDIMETTGLTSGGVTKLIDRLEAAGWVERLDEAVPGDGRGVMVSITDEGRRRLEAMVGVLAERLGETGELIDQIRRLLAV